MSPEARCATPGQPHPPQERPADESLAAYAARVAHGDANAVDELMARLGPFVPQLLAIVRRGRSAPLQARIESTGVVNAALLSLVTGLREHRFDQLVSALGVRDLLVAIVRHKLGTQVRRETRAKRSPAREVPSGEGRPVRAADPAAPPTDVPQALLQAVEASAPPAADAAAETRSYPGPGGPAASAPRLDAAAAELVAWLESWGDELRQVHPKAIDIMEWSFCGWSTAQIGQALDLSHRSVQLIKQKLRTLMEQKLGLRG
jgi:hypothetical protein